MLIEFMAWWTQQLRDLLPRRLARRDTASDAFLVRSLGGLDVALAIRRRGVERPLARATLDSIGLPAARAYAARAGRSGPVVLALPEPMLLEQQTTLPLAAERALGQVLRHEMDRLTPFPPDALFWSWQVLRRDVANARLDLRLAFVPKARLAPLLAALDQAALRPAWLEVASAERLHRIGLTPPGARAAGRSVMVAAGACAGLAVAALAVPVMRQERRIAALDEQIDALRPRVALVDGLRRKLLATTGGAEIFASEAARVGDAVDALATVTDALPDDSYLTQFALRERKLILMGHSAAAARLIGTLSGDPALAGLAFAAPVTRTGGDHGDQFTIRADFVR